MCRTGRLFMGLVLTGGMLTMGTAHAAPAKQVRMDAQNIVKAVEIVKRNPALFNNPENLRAYKQLMSGLNQKTK